MSAIETRRRRPFRAQARELREIARTVKRFGLPGPTPHPVASAPRKPEDGDDG